MSPLALRNIMILIILLFYGFDVFLTLLNLKYQSTELPDEVKDVYDAEKYKKSQQYKKTNSRFSLITTSFTTLLIIAMLYFNGFAYIDSLARKITSNQLAVSLIFFAILYYAYDIIMIPFQLYDTFVIEEKFNFNRTTLKTFVIDKLKSWLITAIIGGLILSALIYIYLKTDNYFWLLALGVIMVFQIFFGLFYTDLILPLFNKLTPLPEGELRSALEAYAQKVGYDLKNVYVIDSSKRSTKLNAYFTGLGPKKKIVLYDTLIDKLSPREIVAVLAHEVGHYKHRHVIINTTIALVVTAIYLYLFQVFSHSKILAQALGVNQPNFHIAAIALGILYTPIDFTIGIFVQMLSRSFERQADTLAKVTASGQDLISALKKLSVENLSNLTPHPLYVFFHYSHPPLLERIKLLSN